MKKQALIHVHQLLALIRGSLADRWETPPRAFEEYDELGVRPSHLHCSKGQHKQAIHLLLEGINEVLPAQEREPVVPAE